MHGTPIGNAMDQAVDKIEPNIPQGLKQQLTREAIAGIIVAAFALTLLCFCCCCCYLRCRRNRRKALRRLGAQRLVSKLRGCRQQVRMTSILTTTILGTGDSQCACEALIAFASVFLCAPGAYRVCERMATPVSARDLRPSFFSQE